MNGLESSFQILEEFGTTQGIGALLTFSAPPNIEALQYRINNLPTVFPELLWAPSRKGGRYFWNKTPAASRESMLRIVELDPIKDVFDAASEELSRPLPFETPQWSFILYSQGSFASLLLRIHHSLCDGIGIMTMIHALSGTSAESSLLPTPDIGLKNRVTPRSNSRLESKFGSFLGAARRMIHELATHSPPTALTGLNSKQRVMRGVTLDVQQLDRYRRHYRATLNDLLVAMLTQASADFLRRRGSSPDSLRTVVPVSLRTREDLVRLGNHLTAVGVDLPIHLAALEDQMAFVHQQFEELRGSGAFQGYDLGSRLTFRLPRPLLRLLHRHHGRRGASIFSTMPGPRQSRWIAGTPLDAMFGAVALLPGHGSGWALIRYGPTLCVSLLTDPAVIPVAEELLVDFENVYHLLCAENEASTNDALPEDPPLTALAD